MSETTGTLRFLPGGGPMYNPLYERLEELQRAPQELVEQVRKMEGACREFGVPLAAAALQFSMRDPRVVSTIVGMSRPERVEQTPELATHSILAELWSEVNFLV